MATKQIVVGTDRAVYLLDHQGTTELSVPLAYDHLSYSATLVRLENPPRFAVNYHPSYFLGLVASNTMPQHLVEYDASGQELSRTSLPAIPFPHVQPMRYQPWFGLVTSPAEAAVLPTRVPLCLLGTTVMRRLATTATM